MNEIEILKVRVEANKALCRNSLINRLEALKTTIENELRRLEDNSYSPSASGIIQSEAGVIDTLSAKLNTLNELL